VNRPAGDREGLGPLRSLLFIGGALALEFVLAAAAWWLAPRLVGRPVADYLAVQSLPAIAGYGMGAGLAAVLVVVVVYALFPRYRRIVHDEVLTQLKKIPALPLMIAGLAAAVGEEIFFRGFLLSWIGIVPSSLLFGALHISPGESWAYYGATTALMGLGLGWLFIATNSLIACMIAHGSYNMLVTVLIFQGFFDLD